MVTSETITDTDRYPVYDTKADFLADFERFVRTGVSSIEQMRESLYRLSNTDTDNWTAGSDDRHDD